MNKWADKGRRPAYFKVGNLMIIKLQPNQPKAYRKVHKGLVRSWDQEDEARNEFEGHAPLNTVTSFDKEVEYVLADRTSSSRGVAKHKEDLVKWKGLPESEAIWERDATLWQFEKQINEYLCEKSTRASTPSGWGGLSQAKPE
ncbi:hypothetical protein AMTR_s00144p00067060 [Amborella trichopoda]|uniref:Chromo domain-containing protein n=1 Tax=Amborella trichopoda TaxID=13333 RepID=W1P9M9_AMBTC|nr:hypothetical protein AMTR_s00144p00067060 [Amborella trichopoda]